MAFAHGPNIPMTASRVHEAALTRKIPYGQKFMAARMPTMPAP